MRYSSYHPSGDLVAEQSQRLEVGTRHRQRVHVLEQVASEVVLMQAECLQLSSSMGMAGSRLKEKSSHWRYVAGAGQDKTCFP
jgi:hypothetical protein